MSSDKSNSFCYKFLQTVSGIQQKTIDTMIDNGFDSVYSLLVIKDGDLNQISDICLGQKALLRKELKELQKEYQTMESVAKQNNYKRLLEEYIGHNECPSKSVINTSNNSSHYTETFTKMTSTPNRWTNANESIQFTEFIDSQQSTITGEEMTIEGPNTSIDKQLMTNERRQSLNNEKPMTGGRQQSAINSQPLIVERRETHINGKPLTVTERFGLRSFFERKKKSLSTDEEDNDNNTTKGQNMPTLELQISRQTKNCKVCDAKAEANGSLCKPCFAFFNYHKTKEQLFVCNKSGECLIKKNYRNQSCQSCRWNKCLKVWDDFDSGHSSSDLWAPNLSLSYFGHQSYDQFMENNKYLSESQPNIDLTPIKLNNNHKYSAKNQKIVREKCAICGDIAMGRKYGALSCVPCAKFFKRAHKSNTRNWKCVQSDDNCEISPLSRNNCRFCRYMCCVRAGMALQSERIVLKQTEQVDGQQNGGEEEGQEVKDNLADVSAPTGDDYASIECGRNPESPKLTKTKRRKY